MLANKNNAVAKGNLGVADFFVAQRAAAKLKAYWRKHKAEQKEKEREARDKEEEEKKLQKDQEKLDHDRRA